jgi:ABC-type Fe3+-hydroxamate transport system substrate-binding protein
VAVRRIVSLVPSTTELLCALGLADALVGVTVYCVEPRAVVRTKTRVGGEKDPDLATIRALAPDLVIANIEENRREDVDALRAAGIDVFVTYPRSVAESLGMIRELGTVTGAVAASRGLLDELEPLHAAVRARLAGRRATPVFYPIWREPWMTIGHDTYIHDLLATCGGANVFADRTRYPTIALEELAARAPEVVLLPNEPFRFRRAHLRDFDAYPALPAVRDGRLLLVDGKRFSWHGPRLAEALRTVPAMLGHSL